MIVNKSGAEAASCPHCGTNLAEPGGHCPACHATSKADSAAPPSGADRAGNSSQESGYQRVLQSRWLVLGVLMTLGPFGFPTLWQSPRFGFGEKILWSVICLLVTTILPAIGIYYLVKLMIIPLWVEFSGMV